MGWLQRDIAKFVAKCLNCQQVKVEHLKLSGLTQITDVATWKWETIKMDFIVGLTQTRTQNDSIWNILDRLTKSAHFILVKCTYTAEDYARIYINKNVSLHGFLFP